MVSRDRLLLQKPVRVDDALRLGKQVGGIHIKRGRGDAAPIQVHIPGAMQQLQVVTNLGGVTKMGNIIFSSVILDLVGSSGSFVL